MDAPRPHRPVSSEFRVWFQTRRSHDHERRAHGGYAESSVKGSKLVAAGATGRVPTRRAFAHGRRHLSPLMAFGLHSRTHGHETVGRGLERGARALLVSASRLFHGGKRTSPAVSHRASRRLLLTCSCAHRREAGTEATHASPTTTPVACPAPFLQCIPFRFCWHGSVA